MKQLCNKLEDGYKKQWLDYLDNLKPSLSIEQLEQINKKLIKDQKQKPKKHTV